MGCFGRSVRATPVEPVLALHSLQHTQGSFNMKRFIMAVLTLLAVGVPIAEAMAASDEAKRRAQCIRHPNLPQCHR